MIIIFTCWCNNELFVFQFKVQRLGTEHVHTTCDNMSILSYIFSTHEKNPKLLDAQLYSDMLPAGLPHMGRENIKILKWLWLMKFIFWTIKFGGEICVFLALFALHYFNYQTRIAIQFGISIFNYQIHFLKSFSHWNC